MRVCHFTVLDIQHIRKDLDSSNFILEARIEKLKNAYTCLRMICPSSVQISREGS